MNDFDAFFGHVFWGRNSAERLFVEYVLDDYANRRKLLRHIGYVCLFDRKPSLELARSDLNAVATAVYLDVVRKLSVDQPAPCRFFWALGGNDPPWALQEVDAINGEETGELICLADSTDWLPVWRQLGLDHARFTLERWARCG